MALTNGGLAAALGRAVSGKSRLAEEASDRSRFLDRFRDHFRAEAHRLQLAELLDKPNASLPRYKAFLAWGEAIMRRYHRLGAGGLKVAGVRTALIDILLDSLVQLASAQVKKVYGADVSLALIALGGYGRAEMCPFSDVDIMFLIPQNRGGDHAKKVQKAFNDAVLYMLWDLALKAGHSTRSAREALEEAEKDIESKNAMIESRFICGNHQLYNKFRREYDRYIRRDNAAVYIEQTLRDQRARREKFGNTVFIQEPDIKNGVGGLRDYHSILWMARLKMDSRDVGQLVADNLLRKTEQTAFVAAYDFLLRVRIELHLHNNRPTDVLSLERQPLIAARLGYGTSDVFKRVEDFMRDYYRAAQTIFRTSEYLEQRLHLDAQTTVRFRSVLAARRYSRREMVDGFLLEENTINAATNHTFSDDPIRLVRIFRHLQQFHATMDFELRRKVEEHRDLLTPEIAQSEDAMRCFRSILQDRGNVAPALRLMHETGILERLIPAWNELNCLVQHEFYHRYTADEHVLNTIDQLDTIFQGQDPTLTAKYRRALDKTEIPGLLYLILLLHDIGKGQGIKGHAEVGAEMSAPILERMRVIPEAREKILRLIRQHLEMARFWQRFDVDEPQSVAVFAKLVGNAETLRYLYALTFCDARGTGTNLWNSYKDTLHTQLYDSTLRYFGERDSVDEEVRMIPKEDIAARVPELSMDEVEAHYNLLPERYFVYTNADEIALHLLMVNRLLHSIAQAESLGTLVPVIEWRDDMNVGLSVVHVVTWDRAGLYYKLAGAFSVAGLNIVSSKALTRADHITIDTFYVTEAEGGVVRNQAARATFQRKLEDALLHNRDLAKEIQARAAEYARTAYLRRDTQLRVSLPASVDIYHELSLRRTIVEIQATDTIGLLFRLAKTIYDHGFDITFARIATERNVAVDTFYIEPVDKTRAYDTSSLLALRESLTSIVEAVDPAAV